MDESTAVFSIYGADASPRFQSQEIETPQAQWPHPTCYPLPGCAPISGRHGGLVSAPPARPGHGVLQQLFTPHPQCAPPSVLTHVATHSTNSLGLAVRPRGQGDTGHTKGLKKRGRCQLGQCARGSRTGRRHAQAACAEALEGTGGLRCQRWEMVRRGSAGLRSRGARLGGGGAEQGQGKQSITAG